MSALTTRRAGGTRRRVLAVWLGFLALSVLAWLGGFLWFAETMPKRVEDPTTPTDAVVVLTGGAGRLDTGVDLLARGLAKKLFISGVYRGVDVAQILRLVKKQGAELECCMVLGHAADDTRGNARETARWMAEQGYRSLRLVTASYHMRRSLLEFRRLMPGVKVIPHPVFPHEFKGQSWWRWPGTFRLLAGEYAKYLIALVRAW